MLRARSVNHPVPAPQAAQPIGLPPELGTIIAEARAEMDRLVHLGELQNDPIRHPIRALSVHLDAVYTLSQQASLTLGQQISAAAQGETRPLEADLRRAVMEGIDARLGHAGRPLNLRTVLVAACVLILVTGAGFGSGYWFRGESPILAGVRAGGHECEDRPDGSRLCWIPVWQKLPPTKGN